ncbi:hypothetical protein ElyMa_002831500 [Elysia marginata]|uniref:Uncharacterized protein n=1 Tax=Elysia marginata TaxID=1093978 RepID=A0AAV4HU76_9GAST|nr:hypothetical protein ElyMa_002831500 [Elysia marginata]
MFSNAQPAKQPTYSANSDNVNDAGSIPVSRDSSSSWVESRPASKQNSAWIFGRGLLSSNISLIEASKSVSYMLFYSGRKAAAACAGKCAKTFAIISMTVGASVFAYTVYSDFFRKADKVDDANAETNVTNHTAGNLTANDTNGTF